MDSSTELEYEEETESDVSSGAVNAVVQSTDWTTETIVSQMRRGNIALNPKFQRRDAWSRQRKSALIESLIVGLPVPQIVLADSHTSSGKFIVLDGKQRLLSILQFWGSENEAVESEGNVVTSKYNGFALSKLDLRSDLQGKTFAEISENPVHEADHNSLCNHTIRTMVIKNWRSNELLHSIFLRLNTGSVSLSPQELRQALHPGRFTDLVDDASADSEPLQTLLRIDGPDPRMRDAEILARFIAFRLFGNEYPGRMKSFLDSAFEKINSDWTRYETQVINAIDDFNRGTNRLLEIFEDKPARKPNSRQFNRAIFDVLIYFQSDANIDNQLTTKFDEVRQAYESLFDRNSNFGSMIESDTAGAPNTYGRFNLWATALEQIVSFPVSPPSPPSPPSPTTLS